MHAAVSSMSSVEIASTRKAGFAMTISAFPNRHYVRSRTYDHQVDGRLLYVDNLSRVGFRSKMTMVMAQIKAKSKTTLAKNKCFIVSPRPSPMNAIMISLAQAIEVNKPIFARLRINKS